MIAWRWFGLVAILWILGASFTEAATFQRITVTPDGSLTPPGDVLNVSLIYYPNDGPLTAVIRAYHIPPAPGLQPAPPAKPDDAAFSGIESKPLRVMGANPNTRDALGFYRQMVTFNRPENTRLHTESFTVPYGDLTLPPGRHQMAYEIEMFDEEQLLWTCASSMQLIDITEEPRVVNPTRKVSRMERIEVPYEILGADGRVQKITQLRNVFVTNDVQLTTVRPIEIEGGFRRVVAQPVGGGVLDDNPLEAEAREVNLARIPWVPKRSPVIYFATNRVVLPGGQAAQRFTNQEAQHVTYGSLRVNVPLKNRVPGTLPQDSIWTRLDPEKHFFLEQAVNQLPEESFFTAMKGVLQPGDRDLLLFIHGFNNNFDFAAMRLAQLQHDAKFPGQALLFSWPSVGSGGENDYRQDEGRSARAIPHLARILSQLIAERRNNPASGEIHLIAHSMGNRVLLGALDQLAPHDPTQPLPFGHIIFAAPDEQASAFQIQVQRAIPRAKSATLYFCKEDKALLASNVIHGVESRAGQVIIPLAGLDNVNSDGANTSFLGHDYFTSTSPLLQDLELLLNFDDRPTRRMPPLQATSLKGFAHWYFP